MVAAAADDGATGNNASASTKRVGANKQRDASAVHVGTICVLNANTKRSRRRNRTVVQKIAGDCVAAVVDRGAAGHRASSHAERVRSYNERDAATVNVHAQGSNAYRR